MTIRKITAIIIMTLIVVASGRADTSDRVALIIGNASYKSVPVLENPIKDARAIAEALRKIGFSVTAIEDADQSSMRQSIKTFSQKASTSSLAIIYYAGHGVQVNGKNYLIPIDASLERANDLSFDAIELEALIQSVEDASHSTIIILDACRDNPFLKKLSSNLSTGRSVSVEKGLSAEVVIGSGTLIAYSTSPGNVALDGSGQNSPFALGLLKYLATPGLEVRQMLTRVRVSVAEATNNQQVPWDNSSLRGDVYLAGNPDAASTGTKKLDLNTSQSVSPLSSLEIADRVWLTTRDTQSLAILEDYIRQFPNTPYASLARNRIAELSNQKKEIDKNRGNNSIDPNSSSDGSKNSNQKKETEKNGKVTPNDQKKFPDTETNSKLDISKGDSTFNDQTSLVKTFYDFLSSANGREAVKLIAPGYRTNPEYSEAHISQFYSNMRARLQVLSIYQEGENKFFVKYYYTNQDGARCRGMANVKTTNINGYFYIADISSNC